MLTFRGVGLSDDVGELEGVEGSTTMPVLDGVEGSTTVPMLAGVEGSTTVSVLDGVEGMNYRTGKFTTKSTMRHKSTMVLPNPSMCELDLRHLQIHLPQPEFQSSYCQNRGRRRRIRDVGESRRRAPHRCRCRAPPLCRCARSSHGFGSTKGTISIWGKWRVWILAVSAELNKGPEVSGR
jgi:hypothetical protein